MTEFAAALRAGIAIFNADEFHAAHDAWEPVWLERETGEDEEEERLLHGLIQYTAAIHHAHAGNVEGAVGLAQSGHDYLAELPAECRGIDLTSVRQYFRAIAVDPSVVERRKVPRMRWYGTAIDYDALDREELVLAARAICDTREEWEESVIDRAGERAIDSAAGNRFHALIADFVREADRRGLIYARLAAHLSENERRSDDVESLFDGDES